MLETSGGVVKRRAPVRLQGEVKAASYYQDGTRPAAAADAAEGGVVVEGAAEVARQTRALLARASEDGRPAPTGI